MIRLRLPLLGRAMGRTRRSKDKDGGFTLVELIVSMSILGLIMSLVTALLIASQKQVASTYIRLDDVDQARTGIDTVSRTLRTAVEPAQLQVNCTSCTGAASTSTALTSAQTSSIQLFANTGSAAGPNLVTFTASYDSVKSQGNLTELIQPPDAGSAPNYSYTSCTIGPGCSILSKAVVRGLKWPLPASMFNYYDNTGAEIVPGSGVSLTPQQLIAVDSIAINLTVKTTNRYNTGPTSIAARVGLPNSGSGVLRTPAPTP